MIKYLFISFALPKVRDISLHSVPFSKKDAATKKGVASFHLPAKQESKCEKGKKKSINYPSLLHCIRKVRVFLPCQKTDMDFPSFSRSIPSINLSRCISEGNRRWYP